MSAESKAVFLSYASQDSEAARRICEALRAAGIEVWFDQSELVGGDAWDAKIRKQIKECALFVPVISANTQTRLEGYFRLEWKLAAQRTHRMADEKAFLLPVVIDATSDAEASVPAEFKSVQWTRLGTGDSWPAFCERAQKLVGSARVLSPRGARPDAKVEMPALNAPGAPPGQSVAVLAFVNLSRDADNEYFSDGISEELLNVLAKIPGLKVSARTSAFSFKGRNIPIPEIARQLGVAYVVEGSVRKAGNRVRITAQLIKAADGFHVWSDNFDRELQDIFAVQDEIAGLIARNLQLTLNVAPRATKVVNPEAHRFVLEGRHFWNLRTNAGLERAVGLFSGALGIDPNFAEAYAGLADAWIIRAWYLGMAGGELAEVAEFFSRGRAAADRALALDPLLSEPHAARGAALFSEHRFAEADQEFREAIRLSPSRGTNYHWYGILLTGMGRLADSIPATEKAVSLDPLQATAYWSAAVNQNRINPARALELTERALALRPGFLPILSEKAVASWLLGRREEALAAARTITADNTSETRWQSDWNAVYVLRAAGFGEEARAHAERMTKELPRGGFRRSFMLATVGEERELFEMTTQIPVMALVFLSSPAWDELRRSPRFRPWLSRIGYLAEFDRVFLEIEQLRANGMAGTKSNVEGSPAE